MGHRVSSSWVNIATDSRVVAVNIPAMREWRQQFPHTLTTFGRDVELLGIVWSSWRCYCFLVHLDVQSTEHGHGTGWGSQLAIVLRIVGFVSKGIVEAKLRCALSQEVWAWGKGTQWLLLDFLAKAFVEALSVLGGHLVGHVWGKLLQTLKGSSCCSYVYKFLYYGSFNFIRPTTCAKSQFTILHLLSCGNMYTVVAKLSIPFRETQIVLV